MAQAGGRAAAPPPGDGARAVSLWLAAVMALAVLCLQVVPVLAPPIAAATGLAPAFVGAWNAGLWASALVGTLLVPWLLARPGTRGGPWAGRRAGPWALAQGCLLLCAAGTACLASGQVAGLVLAAVLIGLGQGLEGPTASQLLAAHVPPARRPLWFSVKQTGVQVGAVVASVLLPVLALAIGWQRAALAAGLLALGLAVALRAPARRHGDAPGGACAAGHGGARPDAAGPEAVDAVPDAVRATGAPAAPASSPALPSAPSLPEPAGIVALLRQRPVLAWLALGAAAFCAVQVVLNGFFVTYAVVERGLPLTQAGAWLGAAQAGGLVGRVFWGWVAARLGTTLPLLQGLGATMALCSAALGWWGPQPLLMVAFGFSASGWNGIFLAEVARCAPAAQAGQATAAVLGIMTLGLVGGPLGFAALGASMGFGTAYTAWAAVAVLGMIALWRAGRVMPADSGPAAV